MITSQIFPSAQAAREYLVSRGFEPFKKGLVRATLKASNGLVAHLGMGLLTSTGQSSRGAGAAWGFTVRVEG